MIEKLTATDMNQKAAVVADMLRRAATGAHVDKAGHVALHADWLLQAADLLDYFHTYNRVREVLNEQRDAGGRTQLDRYVDAVERAS